MSSCYRVFRFVFYVWFKLYNRLGVFHADKVPGEGGVIVVSNHASYLDPLAIATALKRRATFMAKEGLFKIPLIRTFVASYSLPVRRGSPRPSTIKQAVGRLRQGGLIVMFPQGTRAIGGDAVDVKRGVDIIARMSGASIVPVFIRGTEKALPAGSKLLRPAKITVRFGDPLKAEEGEDISVKVQEAWDILKGQGD
ncbi:MAG: lysophospholipid acyltransferase family protein [Thermodesulfovibrionales bacterium]|nr:lysophospholipid acyltransferase family protein [Thermodesulfovibrionales bacterium]